MTTDPNAFQWFSEFKKVFSPRVLLLLVLNGAAFWGNSFASDHAVGMHESYAYSTVVYVWLGFIALQILIITGIVVFDQILETKYDYGDKKKKRKPSRKNNATSSAT